MQLTKQSMAALYPIHITVAYDDGHKVITHTDDVACTQREWRMRYFRHCASIEVQYRGDVMHWARNQPQMRIRHEH